MAHQLQIFSLLLFLLATIKFKPLFNILSLEHCTLALAILVSFNFLLSLGPKKTFKSILLAFGLGLSILLTVNNIYLYPTLGTLVLCVFTFGFFHFLNKEHSFVQSLNLKWSNLMISFGLLLIPLLLISKESILNINLFNFALIISCLSVLKLGSIFLGYHLKTLTTLALSSFLILGSFLYFADFTEWLHLFTIICIALSSIVFGYITLRPDIKILAEKKYKLLFSKPEPIIIGYFLGVAAIGAFLLQTPLAQSNVLDKASLVDSFFTALSAVCVTGLIVLDTPVDFTYFGQLIILILIQLGGLGITTLSAWILLMLSSGRLSVSHEETLKNMSGHTTKFDIKSFLRRIIIYFFTIEFIGSFLLFLSFLKYDHWPMALWRSVFTSVSAFCNAGFALQSDSLVPYQNNIFVLLIVSLLIILGGFAPLMAFDLPKKFIQKKLNLQDKIVILSTFSLLMAGFIYFLAVEWSQSLSHLNYTGKVINAWFQSVTLRTAGFNSVDLTETRSITQFFMIFLMFIGGNPGSTAGGVKTVTMAVLFIMAINALKENEETHIFDKKIPQKVIYRSSLIVFIGFGIHFIAFFLLSMTQNIDPISLMFETFSALGTVGLSTGATSQLDEIGKIIIIFCMLAGRVGPLTFILLLLKRRSKQRWKTPEENIYIT